MEIKKLQGKDCLYNFKFFFSSSPGFNMRRRERMKRKHEQVEIILEKDVENLQNLGEKLEQVHLRLVRACVSRRGKQIKKNSN